MIRRFRHKGLAWFFETGDTRGINAQQAAWLRVLPTSLDGAATPADMNLPGYRLHKLKGHRKGQWALSVCGNWRLVFVFDGDDVADVDLVDYHQETMAQPCRCIIRHTPARSFGRLVSSHWI
jgi:proteic killer suppression protein